MEVKIVEKGKFKVVGLKTVTTMQNNRIPELWEKFNSRWQEIKSRAEINICLGICPYVDMSDFTAETEFEYIAGAVVKDFTNIPDGMITYELPGGKYALVTHKGSLDNLRSTYQYVYNEWLPSSGYKAAARAEFELYDERFKFGEAESELDLYIPVE